MAFSTIIWDKTNDTWDHKYQFTIFSHLIRDNGKYYTFQGGQWVELDTLSPTQEDFKSNSVDLNEITRPRTEVNLTMEGGETVGDGKVYRKYIDASKYGQIEKMEVK